MFIVVSFMERQIFPRRCINALVGSLLMQERLDQRSWWRHNVEFPMLRMDDWRVRLLQKSMTYTLFLGISFLNMSKNYGTRQLVSYSYALFRLCESMYVIHEFKSRES